MNCNSTENPLGPIAGLRPRIVAIGILAAFMAGCGGGGDAATQPSAGSPDIVEPGDKRPRSPVPTPTTTTTTPTTTPTTIPASSTDRVPLGVNLEGLSDWARLQPFVDLMKTARPWGTADAPWDEAATVDAQGWPTGDAAVVVSVRSNEPGDEGRAYRYMVPGAYRLKFTGRATVVPIASGDTVVRSYAYDAATNRSSAEVVVGTAASQLMLSFRGTGSGVKDVSLRPPGSNDTQTFTSEFAQVVGPFGVLRFMDFLHTNGNPVRTWGERTTPASATQASVKGGAHEYAIQMANELGKDIWLNVPALADDAYVRALAQLLKAQLEPGRVVYVEYSNELWNFIFPQARSNLDAAVAEAIAGDRTLTKGQACTQALFDASSGDCNPYWAGYFRVGKRTVRIAQIFSEVFGAAALNTTVRVVYPTQFASPGIAEQVLKNIATYRAKPASVIYGVATAPYFYLSPELVASTAATKDQILASLETSLRTDDEPMFAAGIREGGNFVRKAYTGADHTGASHKALADYHGIKSLAYEAGPDLGQNAANPAAKIAANRDPRMGALVKSEATQWFGCGNDVYMHFSLTSQWDRHGYWGLTNDPADTTSAKYAAMREVAQTARSALTVCR